jgi:DNA repair protein RecO
MITTEAWVMKKKKMPGQDESITLLTKEYGKIHTYARGIKKITSRRGPHIQTGNLIRVTLNEKNNRFYLQQTELISGFSEIKKDSKKIDLLYPFLFILEGLLPEHQQEDDIYLLTREFFIELSGEVLTLERFSSYLSRILFLLGYTDIETDQPFSQVVFRLEELIGEKIPLHVI